MKKILIATLEHPPYIGGIATYVDTLAQGLNTENNVVVWAPPHEKAVEFDATRNYKIIRKNMLGPKWLWPRWIMTCLRMRAICKKEQIDMLMIHHVLPMGYAARFVKKVLKVPFILFSHGTDVVAASRTGWKKRMARGIALTSDQIIANSESLARRMLRPFPELSDKVTVVYPCPETDYYTSPPEADIEAMKDRLALQGKKVILSIARIAEGKGFPHLAAVMLEVVKKNPNVVWIVIGDGPKKDELLEVINKNNLQNIVRYIGSVPHKDLKLFYYVADVFALLTHPDHGIEEGLGLVFLEAAATGLPTIAGRSGGVEEAVAHMQTGIVVDTYQHKQGIDAVLTLIENDDFAHKLGTEGQARVQANFNWDNQLKRLDQWIH